MRKLFVLLLILSMSIVPCVGCGGSKPDPRDHPDFEENADPDLQTGALDGDTGPADGAPAK
jgi:hypothetical protein